MRCATAPSSSATARTVCDIGAGVVGGVADAAHLLGGFERALGGNIDAARDLLRGGALLRHRRRDRAADRADVADGALDRRDRRDRTAGRVLHVGDLLGDVFGGLAGLAGQRLDLARHHGKAAAGLAGARGLDGRVERQQIGLLGDVGDQADDVADALGRLAQLLHRRVGAFGLADRLLGDGVRLRHLAVDLHHRRGKLIGRRRDVAHVGGGLGRGGRGAFGAARGAIGGLGKMAGGLQHLIADGAELGDVASRSKW